MELKKGMYVRTSNNGIGKILEIDELNDLIKIDKEKWIIPKDVISNDNKIINLIEIGDYVNGYPVTTGNQGVGSIYIDLRDELGFRTKLYEKDIKSIVTKEQFEKIMYKIGDTNE